MSEPDPRELWRQEQSTAAFLHMGAGMAAMYRGLKQEGVPEAHAVRIVADYARGVGQGMHRKSEE